MKKIMAMIIIGMVILTSGVVAEAAETREMEPAFTIDGKAVTFDNAVGFPYITDKGSTMMPLRICLNAIGCEVGWNQPTQTVLLSKAGIEVEVPIGKNEIQINHLKVPVDSVSVLKNGRAYLPLRVVMEAFGYAVTWDGINNTVSATAEDKMKFTPFNINGGTTGIFSRKQLAFAGFDGIMGDVKLPLVKIAEKGDCPYVYFGFDWKNDGGNVEGGFQFIEDPNHPSYNKWTVFMRQGNEWRWGENVELEQGSTHHLEFYSVKISERQVDLIIALDGKEIIRKASAITNFENASVKTVTAMAMPKPFDGTNCLSRSIYSKIDNLKVSRWNSDEYMDFKAYKLYQEWKPTIGVGGTWFGTAESIPAYLHLEADGSISIYKGQ